MFTILVLVHEPVHLGEEDDDAAGGGSVSPGFYLAASTERGEECLAALKKVSKGYSRILLLCSNYESTKSDQAFFECLYRFITIVVKLSLPKDGGKAEVEKELGRLFRGESFLLEGDHFTELDRAPGEGGCAACEIQSE